MNNRSSNITTPLLLITLLAFIAVARLIIDHRILINVGLTIQPSEGLEIVVGDHYDDTTRPIDNSMKDFEREIFGSNIPSVIMAGTQKGVSDNKIY